MDCIPTEQCAPTQKGIELGRPRISMVLRTLERRRGLKEKSNAVSHPSPGVSTGGDSSSIICVFSRLLIYRLMVSLEPASSFKILQMRMIGLLSTLVYLFLRARPSCSRRCRPHHYCMNGLLASYASTFVEISS